MFFLHCKCCEALLRLCVKYHLVDFCNWTVLLLNLSALMLTHFTILIRFSSNSFLRVLIENCLLVAYTFWIRFRYLSGFLKFFKLQFLFCPLTVRKFFHSLFKVVVCIWFENMKFSEANSVCVCACARVCVRVEIGNYILHFRSECISTNVFLFSNISRKYWGHF